MLSQEQKDSVKTFWVSKYGDQRACIDMMTTYGVDILMLADAIGTSPEFVYWYLRSAGAPEGFGGFIGEKPPCWNDFYINWDLWYQSQWGYPFRYDFSQNPDFVNTKLLLNREHQQALDWWNATHSKKFLPLPPTWIDVYFVSLTQGYFQQFNDVINRPWNSDADSQKAKLDLDASYIQQLKEYNARYGTDFQPNPNELGINVQPNLYNEHKSGGFLNGIGGLLVLVAIVVIAVYTLQPELLSAVAPSATTGELVALTPQVIPSTAVASVTAGQTAASVSTWAQIQSGFSTVNSVVSGATLANKVVSGQPLGVMDVLQVAGYAANAASYLSSFTGVSNMDDLYVIGDPIDMGDGSWQFNYSDGSVQTVAQDGSYAWVDQSGGLVSSVDNSTSLTTYSGGVTAFREVNGAVTYTYPDGTVVTSMPDGTQMTIPVNNPAQTTVVTSSGASTTVPTASLDWSWKSINDAVKNLSVTVANVLSTVAAVKRIGNPAPLRGDTTAMAGGAYRTVNRNGTVTTRTANGQTTTTALPPGQPYVFSNGDAIVSNGDGTYTMVYADGTTSGGIVPKVGAASGVLSSPIMLAVLGVGAVMLLKK